MKVTDHFERLPLSSIIVNREERQRRELDVTDLLDSIRQHGVLFPIIVSRISIREQCEEQQSYCNYPSCGGCGFPEALLVAGERRLEASRFLSLPSIPVRWIEDLSSIEMQIIELEENLKRQDLPWQDQTRAISRIHSLYISLDPEWTMTETARALSLSLGWISLHLKVAEEMEREAPVRRIAEPGRAGSVREVYNAIARREAREQGNALEDLLKVPPLVSAAPSLPSLSPVLCESFLSWAPAFEGEKFNFIHCDFPYGREVVGPQMLEGEESFYDNSPEVYFSLLDSLCENLPRLLSLSGHLMFWTSSEILQPSPYARETWSRFAKTDLLFSRFPLIWVKSDNSGIASDPLRGPRHVYEVALLASRGGRQIARVVSDAYAAPSDRRLHPSTKPEPMLRHFFSMLVDGTSRVLDPTAGSGTALRAADSLGAERVLGLEISEEYTRVANQAFRAARLLRSASKEERNEK
jgi:ParB-like chromosome segregation protein Spo0J